jgi:hypothetical protein
MVFLCKIVIFHCVCIAVLFSKEAKTVRFPYKLSAVRGITYCISVTKARQFKAWGICI